MKNTCLVTVDVAKSRLDAGPAGFVRLSDVELRVAVFFDMNAGLLKNCGEIYRDVKQYGATFKEVRTALESLHKKLVRQGIGDVLATPGQWEYRWIPLFTLSPKHLQQEPVPAAVTQPPLVVTPEPEEEGPAEAVLDEPVDVQEEGHEGSPADTTDCAPAQEVVWTPERIATLISLWEEGVVTEEIGRRIGVTKNAALGKVHRLGLTPRVVTEKPPPPRKRLDFSSSRCVWPIGHPDEEDFHFCQEPVDPGKPYCPAHRALAYIKPKAEPRAA